MVPIHFQNLLLACSIGFIKSIPHAGRGDQDESLRTLILSVDNHHPKAIIINLDTKAMHSRLVKFIGLHRVSAAPPVAVRHRADFPKHSRWWADRSGVGGMGPKVLFTKVFMRNRCGYARVSQEDSYFGIKMPLTSIFAISDHLPACLEQIGTLTAVGQPYRGDPLPHL